MRITSNDQLVFANFTNLFLILRCIKCTSDVANRVVWFHDTSEKNISCVLWPKLDCQSVQRRSNLHCAAICWMDLKYCLSNLLTFHSVLGRSGISPIECIEWLALVNTECAEGLDQFCKLITPVWRRRVLSQLNILCPIEWNHTTRVHVKTVQ